MDAGFLVAADVSRLLAAIPESTQPLGPDHVRAYKAASLHIRNRSTREAAAYLQLAARQNGAEFRNADMSDAPWTVPWAHWTPPAVNNAIAAGESSITAIETGAGVDGSPVAVVGRENGSVEVWDLVSNVRIVDWKAAAERIHKVGFADTDQGPIVVAAHTGTILAVYEPMTGNTASVDLRAGERDSITALLVTKYQGEWLAVAAQYNLA